MNRRLLGYTEIGGETLIVFAAALWITRSAAIPYIFAVGVLLFAIGRLAQGTDHILAETPQSNKLNMRRLLRQRNVGIIMLLLASALMFVTHTRHIAQDIYIFPSSWLIPFICFVVTEVYTAFRIPHLLK